MDLIYRKLQNLGGSLYVSLPKPWTKKYELKEKSTVTLEVRDDGALTIIPKIEHPNEVLKEEVVLEANQYVIWELLKKSLAGFTNIVISSDKEINQGLRQNISRYVNRLPNTEIIEETKHKMIIQNFGYKEIPTKKIIKRLLDLVTNMFEDKRKNSIDILHDNFVHLRKFYFILVIHIRNYLRTGIYISSKNDFTPLEAMDFRMLCEKNQEIGEILIKLNLSEGILDFYNETEQYFNGVREAFLNKDDKLAYYSWLKKDGLFKKAEEVMKNLDHDERDSINILLRIVQNCKDMAALI
ncbi:MAG: AbrB/MazE/SpoVT family DNA-binding domain-containing protein [Promethearchaeota archaeon]|jgi:antitoxin component of MazEF toxin-antitoxin module